MKKYGRITIVTSKEFKEGLIVEVTSEGVVARKYYKNQFKERMVDTGVRKIDIIAVARMETPDAQMKEIAAQIGTNKFFIDEKVIEEIEDLRNC